jgi:two-component sensor histidine kinase
LRRRLAELGFATLVGDGVVIVNELVTNAVTYAASGPVLVALRLAGSRLILEVWDCSEEPPAMPVDDPDAIGGRGLRVVNALAADVGCDVVPGGKCMWAVLA